MSKKNKSNQPADDNFVPEKQSDVKQEPSTELVNNTLEQNEALLAEVEKLKKEKEAVEAKVPKPRKKSIQELMIDRAREIDKAPISASVRAHAFSQKDKLAVHGLDPNKHYRWASKLDDKLKTVNAQNIQMMEQDGYQVVRDKSLKGPRIGDQSTLETFDLILTELPKEKAIDRAMLPVIKSKSRLTAVQNSAEENGLVGKMKGEKRQYANDLQMTKDNVSLFDVDSVLG